MIHRESVAELGSRSKLAKECSCTPIKVLERSKIDDVHAAPFDVAAREATESKHWVRVFEAKHHVCLAASLEVLLDLRPPQNSKT